MLVSAEIRWFWPDSPPDGLESWFRAGTFPPGGGNPPPRLDEYLVDPGQCELGLKKRGEKKGIEVKGLVTTSVQPVQIGPITARIQVWTKWTSESLRLDGMTTVGTYKLRWLRKFDTTGPTIRELVLGKDEALVNKEDDLPAQGCNVELTIVSLKENGPKWWTLGYEAFGSIDSVKENLRRTIDHFVVTNVSPLHPGFEQSYPEWLSAQLSANARQART
jgi:hypothetical protein